jgi:DNA-binding CsgD family transcriptional regulator
MIEIYWNTAKDMLLHEDLLKGEVIRFDQLPRSFFIRFDAKIRQDYPEQHAELCNIVGSGPKEYGRVYHFCSCNFSSRDGNPDIDDDSNFIFERVSCPIRHACKRTTCKASMSGKLSARELEVIPLFVEGFLEEEIGERLFISKATVHNHITHIYQKLSFTGSNNPDRQLVAYAIKNKLTH